MIYGEQAKKHPALLKTNFREMVIPFLLFFIPIFTLIVIFSVSIFFLHIKNNRTIIENRGQDIVKVATSTIENHFDSIISDLIILSENRNILNFLNTQSTTSRQAIADDFLILSTGKKQYDQIRYLDETGMEVIRVNFNSGSPSIVPEGELQSKGKRYYFSDCFQLDRGQIFVSPFDLNIEKGEVERPLKPMIRFGTPVFDNKGNKRGIVLLNYLGTHLIRALSEATVELPGSLTLVNADGYWIKGMTAEDEWGFMFKEKKQRTFSIDFPTIWPIISSMETGHIRSNGRLFSFATVYPVEEAHKSSTGSGKAFSKSTAHFSGKEYYWKIISYVSAEIFNATTKDKLQKLLLLDFLFITILAIICWMLAWANSSKRIAEA